MIPLPKTTIKQIFEQAETQIDYTLALYRIAFPRWDDIESVDGWPSISNNTALYIMEKAIDFDVKHYPDALNGGLWMNKGFRVEETMREDWVIDIDKLTIQYKEEE